MPKFHDGPNGFLWAALIGLGLVIAASVAHADPAVKAGDTGHAPFFCHEATVMAEFGQKLDTNEDVMDLAMANLLNGKCVYFPMQVGFEFTKPVPGELPLHEVWQVKLSDGSLWYVLHKAVDA